MNVSHTNDMTEFIRQNKTLSYSHVIHDIAFSHPIDDTAETLKINVLPC